MLEWKKSVFKDKLKWDQLRTQLIEMRGTPCGAFLLSKIREQYEDARTKARDEIVNDHPQSAAYYTGVADALEMVLHPEKLAEALIYNDEDG